MKLWKRGIALMLGITMVSTTGFSPVYASETTISTEMVTESQMDIESESETETEVETVLETAGTGVIEETTVETTEETVIETTATTEMVDESIAETESVVETEMVVETETEENIMPLFAAVDYGMISNSQLQWELSDAGELTISGTGKMPDYASGSETPWYKYLSKITAVTIADGVTSIGNKAFEGFSTLATVYVGRNVTTIGANAFKGCAGVTRIKLRVKAETVLTWSKDAFTVDGAQKIGIFYPSDGDTWSWANIDKVKVRFGINNKTGALGIGKWLVESKDSHLGEIEQISVTDAAVSATCTKTGLSEGSHDFLTGVVITPQTTVAKTGHVYEVKTVKATTTSNGYIVKKCKVCGYEEKSNVTDLRNQVVSLMQAWVGILEKSSGHQTILDIYNSIVPLPRGYAMTLKDAWCAATVSAASQKLGYTSIMPTECSCNQMIKLYKAQGTWVEDDAYVPSKGDVIFYAWDDNGKGDCTIEADHTGIVESVSNGIITVIEGNKSNVSNGKDGVGRRKIAVNGRYIRGFGVPNYSKKASDSAQTIYYPKTITLSKTTYIYDGTTQKPTVTVKLSNGTKLSSSNYTVSYESNTKYVGKHYVTIKFKGNYTGTIKKGYIVKPVETRVSKETAKSKGFRIAWPKKTTQVSGYQIQYSLKSNFTNSTKVFVTSSKTTTKLFTKLRGNKKYYVRIRTYKDVKENGKTVRYYSDWSAKKKITTKK